MSYFRAVPAILIVTTCAFAQGKLPAGGYWPVHTKLEWHYEGKLTAQGASRTIAYEVRTKEKELLAGREAFALVMQSKARTLATEWYSFDGSKVLLLKQAAGSEPARLLDPPQVFLDTSKFVEGGTWEWKSADGSETVGAKYAGTDKIKTKDGRERACAVIEMTVRFQAKSTETRGVHEQKRKLWLEPGVGMVREVSTTSAQGADGTAIETSTEVELAKVQGQD